MKTVARILLVLFATGALFVAGCANPPPPQSGRFIQKKPVIVAIIPADNKTDEPAASLVLDKVWEEALVQWGCLVVNADHVVAYAGKTGTDLDSFRNVSLDVLPRLGSELGADYLMYNTITEWDTVPHGMTSNAVISCATVLYEAKTGAVVWEDSWTYMDSAFASDKALSDAIFALAHSSLSTMSNGEAAAAIHAVKYVMDYSMPYPSFEPGTEYAKSKWTSRALLEQTSPVTEESPEEPADEGK
jgi:hypothetical protein